MKAAWLGHGIIVHDFGIHNSKKSQKAVKQCIQCHFKSQLEYPAVASN